MRGTILLLDGQDARAMYDEFFRTTGLFVTATARVEDAMKQAGIISPDVVMILPGSGIGVSVVSDLRPLVDHATSIIVAAGPEDCEPAYHAGADSFLLKSTSPSDVLYEVHRALILRRSGRRLPWNMAAVKSPASDAPRSREQAPGDSTDAK